MKRRRQISDREAKRLKKNEVDDKRKERDKDNIRVEELNYKVRALYLDISGHGLTRSDS